MMLRHANADCWRDKHPVAFTDAVGDDLGSQRVGANQTVGSMLFG